jgi:hypothetical protein
MLIFIKAGPASKVVHKAIPCFAHRGSRAHFHSSSIVYAIPFLSDDGVSLHALWYTHFSKQLGAGDLYPGWLMGT